MVTEKAKICLRNAWFTLFYFKFTPLVSLHATLWYYWIIDKVGWVMPLLLILVALSVFPLLDVKLDWITDHKIGDVLVKLIKKRRFLWLVLLKWATINKLQSGRISKAIGEFVVLRRSKEFSIRRWAKFFDQLRPLLWKLSTSSHDWIEKCSIVIK